jgi:hypothetical protein
LIRVRVPAADVDEADVELVPHQSGHTTRLELEAACGHRVAIGRQHFRRHGATGHHLILFGHGLPQVEALRDERLEARARVHAGQQTYLPVIERGAAGVLE